MTKIIASFAGTGKSFASLKVKNCLDLDSTLYKWDNVNNENIEKLKGNIARKANINWPENYILTIIENLKKYDYILISLNVPEIFDVLKKMGYEYYILLPQLNNKNDVLERLKKRGNTNRFVNQIDDKFEEVLNFYKDFQNVHYLNKNETVLDFINRL